MPTILVKTPFDCKHPKYQDGHCAEMLCPNYYSKCLRHSAPGYAQKASQPCSREAKPADV